MRRLTSACRRLAQVSQRERQLLARALVLVAVTRLALPLGGAARSRVLASRVAPALGDVSPETQAWAVKAAARWVPGATCLTQALALEALLVRNDHDCQVHVGVARAGVPESLSAHAWVSNGGRVLLGADEARGLVPLGVLDTRDHRL